MNKTARVRRRHAHAFALPLTSEGVKEEQESSKSRGRFHGSRGCLLSCAGLYVCVWVGSAPDRDWSRLGAHTAARGGQGREKSAWLTDDAGGAVMGGTRVEKMKRENGEKRQPEALW